MHSRVSVYLQNSRWCTNPIQLKCSWKSLYLTDEVAAGAQVPWVTHIVAWAQIPPTAPELKEWFVPDREREKWANSIIQGPFLLRTLFNCQLSEATRAHSGELLPSCPAHTTQMDEWICLREMKGRYTTTNVRTVGCLGCHEAHKVYHTFQAMDTYNYSHRPTPLAQYFTWC